MTAATSNGFTELLEYLNTSRSVDFTAYKRPSLQRRIDKRIHAVGVDGFESYREFLELHPDEFDALFDALLINVTSFFRDETAWRYVEQDVIPAIIAAKDPTDSIRVWSAGCASGEEPYTAAMLLAQALGVEAFRRRVRIYATDMDEDALRTARTARYSERDLQKLPEDLRSRFFERSGERYAFAVDARRAVLFGRHNLLKDAPISRIDLLICRNTLMYFNSEAQQQVLARFKYALNAAGFLLLGKAETILNDEAGFVPKSLAARVFVKKDGADAPRDAGRPRLSADPAYSDLVGPAFEAGGLPQVVIDIDGTLVLANAAAREFLGIREERTSLEELHITDHAAELRAAVRRAMEARAPFVLQGLQRRTNPDGSIQIVDVIATPLVGTADDTVGIAITIRDVTEEQHVRREAERARGELQAAYEELQSTVEELETTNEELQSSNEELETTNEELQSTNEELETINDELQQRTDELNDVNAFLEAVLGSLSAAVIVVDRELRVQAWNDAARDLWGLRSDEVQGQHLLNLDIGLAVDELRKPVRAVLAGEAAAESLMAAVNRRGRPVSVIVRYAPLANDGNGDVGGAILMMESTTDAEAASA